MIPSISSGEVHLSISWAMGGLVHTITTYCQGRCPEWGAAWLCLGLGVYEPNQLALTAGLWPTSFLSPLHLSLPSPDGFCFLQIMGKKFLVNKKQNKINLQVFDSWGLRKICERDETPVWDRELLLWEHKEHFSIPKGIFSELFPWKKIWLLNVYLNQYFNIILKLIISMSTSWANSLYPRVDIHLFSLLLLKIRYLVWISRQSSGLPSETLRFIPAWNWCLRLSLRHRRWITLWRHPLSS